MNIDIERGRELATMVHAKDKDCYRNAFKALNYVPGGRYVEGYAVKSDFPIVMAHGWVETTDGTVLEVTPAWQVLGVRYFAAQRWTGTELFKAASKKRLLPLDPVSRIGGIPPTYRPAYEAAELAAYGPDAAAQLKEWRKRTVASDG